MNIVNKQLFLALNHLIKQRAATFSKRSYYEILELKPNFSQKDLRKQFLAKGIDDLKQQECIIRI